jgi:hypothetical protein
MRNWIPAQPRKGAKKLVSSNFAKLLEKESWVSFQTIDQNNVIHKQMNNQGFSEQIKRIYTSKE